MRTSTRHAWGLFLTLTLIPQLAHGQDAAPREKLRAQAEAVLDTLHDSAAAADLGRHLGCFTPDAVILGTAPNERFTLDSYRALIEPPMSSGRGWKTLPFEPHVAVSEDGSTAWFDERLRRESGMELRSTGVLRRIGEAWKIALLDTILPVPNERAAELAEQIRDEIRSPTRSIPDSEVAAALVEFHRAGADAELDRHLAFLADDAVLFGTDVHERHTRSSVREWLRPYFAAGQGLDTTPVVLHITEGAGGRFAWFDGRLDKPSLCELRGSGLLRREEDGWKIVQYSRAFVVPNDRIEFCIGRASYTEPIAVDALRADFALLRRTLEEWHPALYEYESEEDIDRLFDVTLRGITEPMTALRFETLLSPLIARVHCVHTKIIPTAGQYRARHFASTYLPIEPQVIDDRLFVRTCYVDGPEGEALAPGAELLGINGLTATQVIARLLAVVSSDGHIRSHKLATLNDTFCSMYATHLGSPARFDVRIRSHHSDEVIELSVPALSPSEWSAAVNLRGPAPRPAVPIETRILAADDAAVLAIHTFQRGRSAWFGETLEEFFTRLESEEIDNLIVDLRHNPGGDPKKGSLLVSYLAEEPFTYFRFDAAENSALDYLGLRQFMKPRAPAEHRFRGRVFVLIGGRNTSTSGHVLSHLKQLGRAVLIGQTSGATWICNDNSKDLVLPASGINVHIARTTYTAAVDGLPPGVGIEPDHVVKRTVTDMLAGTDLEMERALELIREE